MAPPPCPVKGEWSPKIEVRKIKPYDSEQIEDLNKIQ